MKILGPAVALATALPLFGYAQDSEGGPFSYELVFEIQNDWIVDSDTSANEINDTTLTVEGAFSLALGQGGSFNTSLVFEAITDPTDDRFLDLGDHGLFVEELYYAQEFRGAEFILGKFNPAFGVAWDEAYGVYGTDFAEDYEITEKWGAAVNFPLADGLVAQLAVFQADRTILSNSLGDERGQVSIDQGGVSNTDGPESATLSFVAEFGDTVLNAGLQYQSRGVGDTHHQQGAVIGVSHAINGIDMLAEVAYFSDFDGTANDAIFFTGGVSVPIGPVSLSAVYGLRDVEATPTDHLFTVAGEVEIIDGLTGALAYRYGDEGGEESHTIGTLLVYEF